MLVIGSLAEVSNYVGKEVGVSDWITVDQQRINLFADATSDHQWIHVDLARAAKEMPNGKTIAHGFLTVSLIPRLTSGIMRVEGTTRVINYGSNRVRFTNMVPVDSRLRARQVIKSAEPAKGGGLQITSEITMEMEGSDRPALVAETIMVVYP